MVWVSVAATVRINQWWHRVPLLQPATLAAAEDLDCEEFFDTSAGDADGGAGGGGEAEESAYSLQQQIDDYQHTLGDTA